MNKIFLLLALFLRRAATTREERIEEVEMLLISRHPNEN